MLKVTRGPGEAPSTRASGKSSTSPILELGKGATETDVSLTLLIVAEQGGPLFQRARHYARIQGWGAVGAPAVPLSVHPLQRRPSCCCRDAFGTVVAGFVSKAPLILQRGSLEKYNHP